MHVIGMGYLYTKIVCLFSSMVRLARKPVSQKWPAGDHEQDYDPGCIAHLQRESRGTCSVIKQVMSSEVTKQ